jgi:hypothetical protein
MGTDFFDEDLSGGGARREGATTSDAEGEHAGPGTLARHREEVSSGVSDAASQIDRLRSRQEELEKEKTTLEELGKRQDQYETQKRDVIQKLSRGIVLAEKEEGQATRLAALFAEMRARFRDSLSELQSINEEDWSDEEFEAELTRGLAVVESAQSLYEKALARIDASGWQKGGAKAQSDILGAGQLAKPKRPGFGYWLKVGIAVSLPLAVVLVVLFGIWLFVMGIL